MVLDLRVAWLARCKMYACGGPRQEVAGRLPVERRPAQGRGASAPADQDPDCQPDQTGYGQRRERLVANERGDLIGSLAALPCNRLAGLSGRFGQGRASPFGGLARLPGQAVGRV